jgi:hypothetical protein
MEQRSKELHLGSTARDGTAWKHLSSTTAPCSAAGPTPPPTAKRTRPQGGYWVKLKARQAASLPTMKIVNHLYRVYTNFVRVASTKKRPDIYDAYATQATKKPPERRLFEWS